MKDLISFRNEHKISLKPYYEGVEFIQEFSCMFIFIGFFPFVSLFHTQFYLVC